MNKTNKKGQATLGYIMGGAFILMTVAILMFVVPVLQGTSARQLTQMQQQAVANGNNSNEVAVYANATSQITTQVQNQSTVWTAGNTAAVIMFIAGAALAAFSIFGAFRQTGR